MNTNVRECKFILWENTYTYRQKHADKSKLIFQDFSIQKFKTLFDWKEF